MLRSRAPEVRSVSGTKRTCYDCGRESAFAGRANVPNEF